MENFDLLKILIKKYGGIVDRPTKSELQNTVLKEYCRREPITNDEKSHIADIIKQMINNYYDGG
ncbi:MAG: hypothetical protein GC171_02250 [Terrimonas sp.]|nr:hypothetical protein [Terrimonas sp.]